MKIRPPVIQIREEGAEKAAYDLRALGVRARDVRPASRQIERTVTQSGRRRFAQQGPGWPMLADATVERKSTQNQDPRMLRLTNALYESLTSRLEDGSAPTVIILGTSVPYAFFHQKGTSNMPRRPLVGLIPSEQAEVNRTLTAYITRGRR